MTNQFSKRMKKATDAELKQVVDYSSKYVPEAVEAAIHELGNRNNDLSERIKDSKLAKEKRAAYVKEIRRSKAKPSFRFIRSFLKLISKPDTHRIQTSTKNRLLLTCRFYFLTLLFLFISTIPLLILESLELITMPKQRNFIPESYSNADDIFIASLLIPIIAGVVEEIEFRLVLSKYNKKYFDIFFSLLISHILVRSFGQYFMSYSPFYSNLLVQWTALNIIFAIPFYITLSQTNIHSTWFENNWTTAYKYLFYGLAFIFAFAHLPTMVLTEYQLLFWPLVMMPFVVYALVFSYVRIRIGFQYAVLLHFTIDAVVMMIRG